MTTTTTAPETAYIHPLHGRTFKRHQTFDEWLTAWQRTADYDEAMGLLHSLYSSSFGLNQKAVLFLMELADGFQKSIILVSSEERADMAINARVVTSLMELRARFAQKAFAVLCAQFFKPETSNIESAHERPPHHVRALHNPAVREKILWFFRARCDLGEHWLFNFPHEKMLRDCKGQDLQVAAAFLRALVGYAWPMDGYEPSDLLKELRPRLVYVLDAIGKLDILLWPDALNPKVPIKNALKALALSSVDEGKVSLRNALKKGSQAARIIAILDAQD